MSIALHSPDSNPVSLFEACLLTCTGKYYQVLEPWPDWELGLLACIEPGPILQPVPFGSQVPFGLQDLDKSPGDCQWSYTFRLFPLLVSMAYPRKV